MKYLPNYPTTKNSYLCFTFGFIISLIKFVFVNLYLSLFAKRSTIVFVHIANTEYIARVFVTLWQVFFVVCAYVRNTTQRLMGML
jgi:hypothetical protein